MRAWPKPAWRMLGGLTLALAGGCTERKNTPPPVRKEATATLPAAPTIDRTLLHVFAPPLPSDPAPASDAGAASIALGKTLYFDPRLSKNQDVSCSTCHALDDYGVDHAPTSAGHRGQRGTRNSPTVYNASLQSAQFWDGRAKDVEAQALAPFLNPVEMAMPNESAIVTVLRSMPAYVAAFRTAFPTEKEPLTFSNVGRAIGSFERTLMTPGRWDRYLAGDDDALTLAERAGLARFLDLGCNGCHTSTGVGGRDFKRLGHAKPWPQPLRDEGRKEVTHDAADQYVFKVPSLRNVEKTAPYFHDGSVATLDEAIQLMGTYQLGRTLDPADVASLVVFLKSLTGDLPTIERPTLPKSTSRTPGADPT